MTDLINESCIAAKPESGRAEARKQQLIKEYESNPVSSGRTHYLRFLRGEKLTYMEAVLAKCAECNCGYIDGRYDCEIPACPLYQFMPYKGKR